MILTPKLERTIEVPFKEERGSYGRNCGRTYVVGMMGRSPCKIRNEILEKNKADIVRKTAAERGSYRVQDEANRVVDQIVREKRQMSSIMS